MKRYKLEHEPLPDFVLYADENDPFPFVLITGDVNDRLKVLNDLVEKLEKFRKECWREIDREKNATLLKSYIKEIEELKKKLGE